MNKAFIVGLVLAAAHCAHSQVVPKQAQALSLSQEASKMLTFSLKLISQNERQVKKRLDKYSAALAAKVASGALTAEQAQAQSTAVATAYAGKYAELRALVNAKGLDQLSQIAAIIKSNDVDAVAKINVVLKQAEQDQVDLVNIIGPMIQEADRLDFGPAPVPAEDRNAALARQLRG
ncbi:hypothetical protein HDE_04504 [Halotydeus destructor]|nr:hypothetical protein HDE_04504 [Halotydeus destructor]